MQPISEAQIRAMSVEERLRLIETVWDTLELTELPLSDEEQAELDRRLDQPAAGAAVPWEQVRAELERG